MGKKKSDRHAPRPRGTTEVENAAIRAIALTNVKSKVYAMEHFLHEIKRGIAACVAIGRSEDATADAILFVADSLQDQFNCLEGQWQSLFQDVNDAFPGPAIYENEDREAA